MTLVIIVIIAIILFAVAFVTKRRFGVLGLALAGGVVLSQLWSVGFSLLLKDQRLAVPSFSPLTIAQVFLILLPPLLLALGGPKYSSRRSAFIGALAFSLLATLFVIGPLTRDLPTTDSMSSVFNFLAAWQNELIAAGVVFAILDMLLLHGPKLPGRRKEKD